LTLAALSGGVFEYVPGFFAVFNRWNTASTSSMPFAQRFALSASVGGNVSRRDREGRNARRLKRVQGIYSIPHILNACYYNPNLTILPTVLIGDIDLSVYTTRSGR